jgi:hypothetical protein
MALNFQLKINVLALPMWRYPVGDGAKRTLSMGKFQDNIKVNYGRRSMAKRPN